MTAGTGKRLFADGTCSATWKLVKSRVGDTSVIIATYEPGGELVTGTIGAYPGRTVRSLQGSTGELRSPAYPSRD